MIVTKGRILIVEDDPDLAENLVEILEGLDWAVRVAPTAEMALELVGAESYLGVITDFRLPGLGGVELISRLREAGADIPVVVMSAFMDESSAARAERAGALDVLPKPIDLTQLFQLLEAFLRSSKQVLIVEDNAALAENVAEALRQEGLAAEVASDGGSALAQHMLPRVALVDLRLPDFDGVEVARRLFARDPSIKILFVTAYGEDLLQGELARSLRELPCVDRGAPCMHKPFSLPELVGRIRNAI